VRTRKLDEIARHWWRQNEWDYFAEYVSQILEHRTDLVPRLLRSLVKAAPAEGPRQVGPSIVEELEINAELAGRPSRTIDLIIAARLAPDQLFEILRGVWVDYLENMDVRHRLAANLPTESIDWLLDGSNSVRYSSTFAER
jgi:hypothetical protein